MKNKEAELGKLPPQATEIEDAVLAAVLLEKEAYSNISGIINSESFYKQSNIEIFNAVEQLHQQNKVIDLLTVTDYLKKIGKLDEVGGPLYISQLTTKIASAVHVEYHARIVQQKFIQREIIRLSSEALTKSYDEDFEDIDELIFEFISKMESLGDKSTIDGLMSDTVSYNAIKEIETDCEKALRGETPGITTGFKFLNESIGGWKAPNFVVLGARPSVGKTTEALHFAINAAKEGYWVNFYTYEMVSTDLIKIIMAGESNINRSDIRDGKISAEEFDLLTQYANEIRNFPIIWYDNPNIKASHIRSNTFKNKRTGKCDIVIIDYLQLIPAENSSDNRERQISVISRILKMITTSIKVPVIALSQLNRDIEKRKDSQPQLSDLRESGSLEQDSDIILFSWVEKDDDDNVIERWNKIAKNRRGKVGLFQIWDDGQMSKLFDYDPRNLNSLNEAYEQSAQRFEKGPF